MEFYSLCHMFGFFCQITYHKHGFSEVTADLWTQPGVGRLWETLVGSGGQHALNIGGVLAPQWNGPLMECRRPMGRASWNWEVWTEHPFFSWPWCSVPLPRALDESWCELDSIRIFDVVSNCLIFCSIANISVWSGEKFTNMWCEQKTFYRKILYFLFLLLIFLVLCFVSWQLSFFLIFTLIKPWRRFFLNCSPYCTCTFALIWICYSIEFSKQCLIQQYCLFKKSFRNFWNCSGIYLAGPY